MLEDSILLNMNSIRDGDRVSMIPASSLNNYVAGLAHKEKESNPNPQANVLPCTPMLPKLPPSLQSLQEQISQATQPLRDMQALQYNLPKPLLTPQNSNPIEVGTTQTIADLKPEQQSQFRPSPQMHLFKVISSMLPRDITQQVKQAALQNGFRALQENKDPFTARDGSQKLFFCCHHKQNRCLFRLQYMRKSETELFSYYKGRDMHNHSFLD